MVICIKELLSNIWNSICNKIKKHRSWVVKNVAYKKSVYIVQDLLWVNYVNSDFKNWMAKIRQIQLQFINSV